MKRPQSPLLCRFSASERPGDGRRAGAGGADEVRADHHAGEAYHHHEPGAPVPAFGSGHSQVES